MYWLVDILFLYVGLYVIKFWNCEWIIYDVIDFFIIKILFSYVDEINLLIIKVFCIFFFVNMKLDIIYKRKKKIREIY